jgi:hypothetical protein
MAFSYFIGRMIGSPDPLPSMMNLSRGALRRLTFMLIAFAVGTLLFFGGFVTILVDLILASYTLGQITLTNLSWVGFGLILVSALLYSFTLTDAFWKPVAVQPKVSPLTQALARLVSDFVDERQSYRAMTTPDVPHNGSPQYRAEHEDRRAYMS